ncbi:MAG: protein involved in polysaccharide export with SLBB domain [Gammaproteobacteria bacterium]|jgi:protein involved in polysaccharide export with SLBB domain
MSNFARPMVSSLLVLMLLVSAKPIYGAMAPLAEDPLLPQPAAELQPGDVVKIIIDALANNDAPFPDAGIETTFNFASPANRSQTGPLERFVKLVKGPVFGQMINHRDSTISDVILDGNKAVLLVQIIGANNETLYFAFQMALQLQGDYAGTWLTAAVWPIDSPSGEVWAL